MPTLDEEGVKASVEKFKGIVEANGGEIVAIDEWGKKRLAYAIDYKTEGYYVLMSFSCAPELVLVETGRDGEDWRVLFHPDHRYELRRASEPLEGTRVSVLKAMGPADYREFARRSEESVRRWCRHSEAEVCFAAGGDDGSPPAAPVPVREPLRADAPFQVEERDPGVWIVAGPARQEPPLVGFYNRGLTLLETREPLLPGISFRAVSDLLEHTLTRDNVRRDAGFERLLSRVEKLARGPLKERLPGELRAAAEADPPGEDYLVLLRYAVGVLPRRGLCFPLVGGGAVDGDALLAFARRQGRLFHGEPSPLAAALRGAGVPVLRLSPEALPLLEKALSAACVAIDAEYSWCEPLPQPEGAGALLRELLALLRAAGGRCRELRLGRLHGAGSDRLAVAVAEAGAPLPAAQALGSLFEAEVLALDAGRPQLATAITLAGRSPRLAAYLLARLLAVGPGLLDEARDVQLTLAALA